MYPNLMDYVPGPHKKIGKYFNMIYDILAESIKHHSETLDSENPRDYIDCFLMKIKEVIVTWIYIQLESILWGSPKGRMKSQIVCDSFVQ